MRGRVVLAVVLGVAAFAPATAHAEWKGYDCQGGYLVGFAARAGDYVDQIGAMCAPWVVATQHLGAPYPGPMFAWSPGGNPQSPTCPADMAITEVDYVLPSINGIEVLERVTMKCQSVLPPYGGSVELPRIVTAGDAISQMPRAGSWDPNYEHPACREGAVAFGFEANVDRYVGSLKLHCGPPPTLAPPPATSAPIVTSTQHQGPPIASMGHVGHVSSASAPVVSTGPPTTPLPSTAQAQTLSITCAKSAGEICMTPGFVTFMADGKPGTWTVRLTAPARHCSSIIFIATGPAPVEMRGSTGGLAAGEARDIDIGQDLPAGQQSIRINAVGVRGGCNSGVIVSWGLEAAVYQRTK